MSPEDAMGHALRAARGASGRAFPNPPVGAVLVRGNQVLGRGFSQPAGAAHAEIEALRRATRRHGARAVRAATMAVTLEPCAHHGRTGPCCQAILDAGVRRVVVGHRDPYPKVAGRGIRQLRRAGVDVTVGVREAECREQHRGFLSVVERGRPFVALKLAATLDGRIATRHGESRWITGPESRARVHRLRDEHDAVMVGAGTARADDPSLSVRRGDRVLRVPVRVVVDGRLRVPTRARLLREDAEQTWILTSREAAARRGAARSRSGARVLPVRRRGEHLDLRQGLARLAREGLTSVLVEGGGGLAGALLSAGLVDELHWFAAPSLLGADGRAAVGALGVARLGDQPALAIRSVRRLGKDLYVHARFEDPGRARGTR